MFERNEKYGHALHLQYGAQNSHDSGAGATNQHFGVISYLKSLIARSDSRDLNETVEVDLSRGTPATDRIAAEYAVNENQVALRRGKIVN